MKKILISKHVILNILNFLLFQFVWFSSVFSIVYGMSFLGIILVLFVAVFYIFISNYPGRLLFFYCLSAIFGFLVDTLLLNFGVISLTPTFFMNTIFQISPLIMVMFWVNFVATFDYSLSWILKHKWLGSILGALGAPLSYFSAYKLGAITLGPTVMYGLLVIAATWLFVMPILQTIFQRVVRK